MYFGGVPGSVGGNITAGNNNYGLTGNYTSVKGGLGAAPEMDVVPSGGLKKSPNVGSNINAAGIISGAEGLLNIVGGAVEEGMGKKYKQAASNYENTMTNGSVNNINSITGLITNDTLMSGFNAFRDISSPVISKKGVGQMVGQGLGASMQGAQAGMSVGGPWGALAGAVVGGITDIAGQIAGGKQRRKAQERINNATKSYNDLISKSLNNQISKVDSINDKNAMSNYFAFGGDLIPMSSSAVEYDFLNKDLAIKNAAVLNLGLTNPSQGLQNVNSFACGGRKYENGGNLFSVIPNESQHGGIFGNGLDFIGSGGSHESNPYGGVQMGLDQEGVPNMVEEGEVKWNDYIFSNRLILDDVDAVNNSLLSKYIGKTFADIAKEINEESSERPNDPIAKNTLNNALTRLMSAQEAEKSVEEINELNTFASGGYLNEMIQAAPIIGTGIRTITDAFGATNADDFSLIDQAQTPNSYIPIAPERVANYMSYVPLDRNYYTNRQAAQTAATRNAVMDASNGNRGALMNALTAVDFGGNLAEGQLARQAEEMDLNQRMQVANFNRGTNMFNSQAELQAAQANQAAFQRNAQFAGQMEMQKAQARQALNLHNRAERDANLSSFMQNLTNYGKESIAMETIRNNPGLYYYWDKDGVHYKNGFENLPPDQKAIIVADAEENKPTNTKAHGGRLTIK